MQRNIPEACKKMSEVASAEVGARIGFWSKQRWPTAKHMARELNIALSTAEKIRAGNKPQNRTIEQMARLPGFGWRFLHYVYEPIAGAAPLAARLTTELAEARDRIDRVQAKLATLKDTE